MPGTKIKVVDKIVQVMELLANSTEKMPLANVSRDLGLNKITALRVLRALESHNLVARDESKAYMLGPRVLWWESCFRRNFQSLGIIRPSLDRLRHLTSETVTLSILAGNRTVVIDQSISPHLTSTRFELGSSAPLHAGASGRVFLSHMGPEERENVLRQTVLNQVTDKTIGNKAHLRKVLAQCKLDGFAISKGERIPNTTSIAAPVFGLYGKVLGVISVVGPSARLTTGRYHSIIPILLKEVRLLTNVMTKSDGNEPRDRRPINQPYRRSNR
jgi:DNA-binding IclR family transcriptional regulator